MTQQIQGSVGEYEKDKAQEVTVLSPRPTYTSVGQDQKLAEASNMTQTGDGHMTHRCTYHFFISILNSNKSVRTCKEGGLLQEMATWHMTVGKDSLPRLTRDPGLYTSYTCVHEHMHTQFTQQAHTQRLCTLNTSVHEWAYSPANIYVCLGAKACVVPAYIWSWLKKVETLIRSCHDIMTSCLKFPTLALQECWCWLVKATEYLSNLDLLGFRSR